jgi:hypothetical protein
LCSDHQAVCVIDRKPRYLPGLITWVGFTANDTAPERERDYTQTHVLENAGQFFGPHLYAGLFQNFAGYPVRWGLASSSTPPGGTHRPSSRR